MLCFQEKGEPSPLAIEVEYTNDERLLGRCPYGHEGAIAVQNFDCEVLFDMGGMAFQDGFTREAVTAFAAALERAYELYVRVIFERENEPPSWDDKSAEAQSFKRLDSVFDPLWKQHLGKLSERQLGAFMVLFALNERDAPPLLSTEWVAFRNKCTHQGVIPGRGKALGYGREVMRIIEQIRKTTFEKYREALSRVTHKHLVQKGAAGGTTMHLPSMINWIAPNPNPLESRLQDLAKYRKWLWSV
jgi:hypothetical protein